LTENIKQYTVRDKELFERLVQAQASRDRSRASILASEIEEIRKQRILLENTKLSLESIVLRLRTVYEYGDFISSVTPIAENLQSVEGRFSQILPNISNDLRKIGIDLDGFSVGEKKGAEVGLDFKTSSTDVQKILGDAAMMAGSHGKRDIPDRPSSESDQ